ncbi:MAG: TatD family hydrolase [Planctomycetota bacterium]|nr:TatD family hydrolase [Planctomycetota bacterium]
MHSRVTDDYERMSLAGIRVVMEPAFWLGGARTHAGTFYDYFDGILGFETERAAQFGILHFVTLSMNPKEANDRKLSKEVIDHMEANYLDRKGVVGVGEIGFDSTTDAEEEAIRLQLEVARKKDLPVLIHTPHQRKAQGTRRSLDILKEMDYDPEKVIIDHNTEETTGMVRDAGCWAGHTVYPVTKLSPDRAANIVTKYGVEKMLINSSADWGPSDVLSVPQTVRELRRRNFPEKEIASLVWQNPIDFFSQSGRLDLGNLV